MFLKGLFAGALGLVAIEGPPLSARDRTLVNDETARLAAHRASVLASVVEG